MIRSPIRFFLLSGILFGLWLLLSGVYIPRLIITGAVVALAVSWAVDYFRLLDEEALPFEVLPRAVGYWFWLAIEIVKSAINVTKIILNPKLPISPTIIVFKPTQKTDTGLATHANSITLTPGTITTGISAANSTIEVHAIERDGAAGCVGSDMDVRVSDFEQAMVRGKS